MDNFLHIPGADKSIMVDRRHHRRYSISMETHWQLLPEGRYGEGRTVNLSSGGILIETDDSLKPGQSLDVTISLPQLVGVNPPRVLLVHVLVLRASDKKVAALMVRHRFILKPDPSLEWGLMWPSYVRRGRREWLT